MAYSGAAKRTAAAVSEVPAEAAAECNISDNRDKGCQINACRMLSLTPSRRPHRGAAAAGAAAAVAAEAMKVASAAASDLPKHTRLDAWCRGCCHCDGCSSSSSSSSNNISCCTISSQSRHCSAAAAVAAASVASSTATSGSFSVRRVPAMPGFFQLVQLLLAVMCCCCCCSV